MILIADSSALVWKFLFAFRELKSNKMIKYN